jgi:hypothetical protein
VIVIRPRKGGPGFKYAIPISALAKLGPMNNNLDERGRHDAVMATDGMDRRAYSGRAVLHLRLVYFGMELGQARREGSP